MLFMVQNFLILCRSLCERLDLKASFVGVEIYGEDFEYTSHRYVSPSSLPADFRTILERGRPVTPQKAS